MRSLPASLIRLALPLLVAAADSCRPHGQLPACVQTPPPRGPTIESQTGGDPVLLAAGDIAYPGDARGAEATARLLDRTNGLVAALGDEVQGSGSVDEFLDDYEPTWGRHRWRTRPTPGNHEYRTADAGPYFAYFCAAAGKPFRGWYAYDLGTWRIIVLNSVCGDRDGPTGRAPACDVLSEQARWLRGELASRDSDCTLAYWHEPLFTSGDVGDKLAMSALWKLLYEARADVVLSGHAHMYERFAPQTADGTRDDARGLREFVVGTGGTSLDGVAHVHANSELRITGTWGVLALTLHASSYDWSFVDVGGKVLDSGAARCH